MSQATVEPWGLRHDRRWVVLQPDGTVLTAREDHRLLALSADPTDEGIQLTSHRGATVQVANPVDGELVETSTSRLESVRLADEGANSWLSAQLERPLRLAWLDDPRRRSVSVDHGGTSTDSLSLADAGPLLLTSTASLAQLNEWIVADSVARGDEPPAHMEMPRFRPNVVVDEAPGAFEEDGWLSLRIGAAKLRFAEHCDRCVMTTIDPHTLVAGKEPLGTLAAHRQWDHKTWFGIRLIPVAPSVIAVGDSVEVITRAD